jgi:N-methylhydantoinase B
MKDTTIDPVTLTVVWNSLISIADELGVTLRHTAFSEGVREGDDFSTAIFTRDETMIAQGNFSPGHLGSMPAMAKTVLKYFPRDSLRPGDSILVNDSFIGAGHFPDTYEIMPVFLGECIIGFVACSAHQVDMGGAAPGSQKVHGVTEAFQEGLRILPVRFVREGKIDEDILRIVLGNVPMPDKVRGDLLAQHTANLTASARLSQMFSDYGTEVVESAPWGLSPIGPIPISAVSTTVRDARLLCTTCRWQAMAAAMGPMGLKDYAPL